MTEPFALKLPGLPVVLMTNTKGGSGKTSTVQNFAIAAKLAGYRVIVLDLDPNGSICKWDGRRHYTRAAQKAKERFGRAPSKEELRELLREPDPPDEILVSPMQPHALAHALELAQANGRNFAIIDVQGAKQNFTNEAAEVSDVVLIPTRPSTKEMENLRDILNQLALGGDPPRFLSFNRVHASTTSGLEGPRSFAREQFKLDVMPVHFTHRQNLYDKADDMGLAVQEIEPGGQAAKEADAAFRFISEFLNLGREQDDGGIERP